MTNRQNIPSWLSILLLTGLGISVSPHQGLTRTSEVSRALSPVLSSYRVIRMEPGEIERQVRTTGELRFRFNDTDLYFNLEPHDMRAPDYRAVETGPGGVRRTLPPQAVHTFKGVLAGKEDTRGRFNLTDNGVEGVVYAPEGWVYLEPVRNYLPGAPAGELVVYSHADVKPDRGLKCGVSLPERLQRGLDRVEARAGSTTPVNFVVEVATEADYEYVQALGGSVAANREIEGILNQVEGVYQSELLLQLQITYQHAWDMEDDPYTATDTFDLLTEFQDHWQETLSETKDYDLAHLWTGKTLVPAGLAYIAIVCLDRSISYGLSAWSSALTGKYNLTAHEIGHNLGATHPNEHHAPVSGCRDTVMQLTLGDPTFCEFSRQEIANHLAGNNQCLTPLPITLQPPSDLIATTVSNSRIDLTWQDNSSNETGFLVQQRRDALPDDDWVQPWIAVATTAANITGFSDDGLLPGTFYHHRVRAFNDTESSAFSNAVLAATLGIEPPTSLRTRGVSNSHIGLAWQDNSSNETGFRVQRKLRGSPDWVSIATTAANVTGFSDGGVLPNTFYYYQIQAFNDAESSTFSNELLATTREIQNLAGPGIQSPTELTATAVSSSGIDLTWQDNSSNEVSFHLQRRIDGTPDWGPLGMTHAGVNRIRDDFLPSGSTYHYRVRAFDGAEYSAFSNEASATTLRLGIESPTQLTASAVSSSRIDLTWQDNSDNETGFHLQRRIDGTPDWVSIAITAANVTDFGDGRLLPSAIYHYRVRAFNGSESSAFSNESVAAAIRSRLFVPIVLRSRGRTPDSLFTSELTLTNRGSTTAEIHYTYRASFGGGSGTAVDFLEAGRQRIVPDAIAYLTSLGVPIGKGPAGGTLAVECFNLSSEAAAAVTVRTSTPVEGGAGQAGLAYVGVPSEDLLSGTTVIAGLRQNRADRSNVALQNAGEASDGAITLRVTVFSGDPKASQGLVLPDLWLPPGGFHQYNGILTEAGFENGYARVERVGGPAPYYAYGVINDNFNSDGSFVFPVAEESLRGTSGQTLPVIVETGGFSSELTVTNFSSLNKQADFSFGAEAIEADGAATYSLRLQAGEQSILPDIVDHLRGQGVAGIGPAGRVFAGALFARVLEGDTSGIVIGARTGSPGGGGQYGVFYNALPDGSGSTDSAWIYGLQRNAANRSNLALVNTGEVDDGESVFSLDIYDGETGRLVRTVTTDAIPARGWRQFNGILKTHAPATAQGYVQVRKLSGNNPFLSYGVVNDGGAPGERSGDGAYLPSQ